MVKAGLLDERQQLLELRLGFARKADDEGRPQARAGQPLAQAGEQVDRLFSGGRPLHPSEQRIGNVL